MSARLLLIGTILSSSAIAMAAEPELKPIVVTATRSEADPHLAPHVVETLTAEDLQNRQVRSLPESLALMPGVMVQKTSNGQGSPYIRGFTGFRTLTLIDGIRFNNSTFRDGPNQYWNTIDTMSIDSMELVQSQGSVLYGSDAIGGTLNLLTRRALYETEAEGQFFIHGHTLHRWSSAEQSYIGRLETQLGVGKEWGLHLGATLKNFGDVRAAGLGVQPYTGYDEWSYDARLDVKLSDQWELTLAHQALQQRDAWRTHSTIYGVSWAGTEVGSDLRRVFDQNRSLSYLKLKGEDLDGFIDRATLTLSYQSGMELQDRIRKERKRELSGLDIDTYGIDLQLESDSPLGRLTYGVDYYHDEVDSHRLDYKPDGSLDKKRIQGPVGDDASYQLLGVYLQDQIELNDRVTLFLGGRYTHARADIGRFEDPVSKAADAYSAAWDNAVFSARLSADLDKAEHYKLYGGVSQGFRAPNLSDLSRLDIARSGELETPVTNLDPERFINFELGVKARTDKFTGGLAYFYTDIQDLIVRRPTGRSVGEDVEVSKSNASSGFVHGVELSGSYQLSSQWSLFGNVTWIEGDADAYPGVGGQSVREPLSKIQPIIGNFGVRWTTESRKVWLEVVGITAAKADRLNSADLADTQRIPPGGTPGYTLLSLRSGWQVTDNVLLLASVENLLDQDFRTHGSGSNEPGIGVNLGVKVSF